MGARDARNRNREEGEDMGGARENDKNYFFNVFYTRWRCKFQRWADSNPSKVWNSHEEIFQLKIASFTQISVTDDFSTKKFKRQVVQYAWNGQEFFLLWMPTLHAAFSTYCTVYTLSSFEPTIPPPSEHHVCPGQIRVVHTTIGSGVDGQRETNLPRHTFFSLVSVRLSYPPRYEGESLLPRHNPAPHLVRGRRNPGARRGRGSGQCR